MKYILLFTNQQFLVQQPIIPQPQSNSQMPSEPLANKNSSIVTSSAQMAPLPFQQDIYFYHNS